MTAVLVPNRPGDKGGYQQLAPEDMPDLLKIDSDNLDDHLLPDRLKRRMVKKNKKGKKGNQKNLSDSDAALMKSDADLLKSKAADAAAEAAGVRPPPMFREVVWNEYCVLFPDGSHTPFNDEVRYTNLRGYLRKRHVVTDGGTEHALQYGSPRRGWHRHYIYANLKLLAWFEVDPEATPTPTPLQNLKLSLSRGKGLGSVHLDTSDCHLYAHRQYPNEFAVRFSSEEVANEAGVPQPREYQLLQLQAASEEDARSWMVAIASCLYFCSSAFAELIEDCGRFFAAVPKSYDDGRLSVVEALDLLRAMGRETTLEQVEACAELTATGEKRFDAREFAFLVRYVCSEVEPAGELLRAFETFDPRGHNAVSADALVAQLVHGGVPPDEVEAVLRAAGPSAHGNIHYVRLVRALYPHSAADADERLRETGSVASGSGRASLGAVSGCGSAAPQSPRRSDATERGAEREAEQPQQRVSASDLVAGQKKRASLAKEKRLREQEGAELQRHRQSLALQRQPSSDDDLVARPASLGPMGGGAAAAAAAGPGVAQCASCATGAAASSVENMHRI